MNFSDLVRTRKMVRSFQSTPVNESLIADCVDLARRAPSAGKSQGWDLLLLSGAETSRYWDIALPREKRNTFAFPDLLQAPCLALTLANSQSYLDRYSEPDKEKTHLGNSKDAWVAPYWTIDASFSTMTFLLALHDKGLGALFFAHSQEEQLRTEFHIPEHVEILGALAFGYVKENDRPGRSSARSLRDVTDIVHRSTW